MWIQLHLKKKLELKQKSQRILLFLSASPFINAQSPLSGECSPSSPLQQAVPHSVLCGTYLISSLVVDV